MDSFGIGFGEILLIIIVALLIWGPVRAVEIARTLGKTVHAFRKAASNLTAEFNREIALEEEKKHLPPTGSKSEAKAPPQNNEPKS